jgi:hypothetical protein
MKKYMINENASMMCYDEKQNATVRLPHGNNDIEVLDGDFTDPDLDKKMDLNVYYAELRRRLIIIQRTTNYHV